MAERHLTLSTAESCTGGLIASTITDVPGSSEYFLGGVVTYSNPAKRQLLDVPEKSLAQFGAVSAPVAIAMAQGARRLLGADIAVAATGIAGPGGGTLTKPVGLVYVALAADNCLVCRRRILPYDRIGNKHATVAEALSLILEHSSRHISRRS